MPRRKKRPAGSKATAKRTPNTAPSRAVFVPPSFDARPSVKDEVIEGAKRAAVRGLAGDPVVRRTFVPPTFTEDRPAKQHGLDFDVLREYAAERTRAGFDGRGVCRYGCDGMLSVIGRVRPPVAMHGVACEYWDTTEGIKDMMALERQRD